MVKKIVQIGAIAIAYASLAFTAVAVDSNVQGSSATSGVLQFSNASSNVVFSSTACTVSGSVYSETLGLVDLSGLTISYAIGAGTAFVNGSVRTQSGDVIYFNTNGARVMIRNIKTAAGSAIPMEGNAVSPTLGSFSFNGVTTTWRPNCRDEDPQPDPDNGGSHWYPDGLVCPSPKPTYDLRLGNKYKTNRDAITGYQVSALQEYLFQFKDDPAFKISASTPTRNSRITGTFGSVTDKSVKALQTKAGLPATGVVDQTTRDAIMASCSPWVMADKVACPLPAIEGALAYQDSNTKLGNDQVSTLQAFLLQFRELTDDSSIFPASRNSFVTGFYGTRTRAAVRWFQSKFGVVPSDNDEYGKVGPLTAIAIVDNCDPSKTPPDNTVADRVTPTKIGSGTCQSNGVTAIPDLDEAFCLVRPNSAVNDHMWNDSNKAFNCRKYNIPPCMPGYPLENCVSEELSRNYVDGKYKGCHGLGMELITATVPQIMSQAQRVNFDPNNYRWQTKKLSCDLKIANRSEPVNGDLPFATGPIINPNPNFSEFKSLFNVTDTATAGRTCKGPNWNAFSAQYSKQLKDVTCASTVSRTWGFFDDAKSKYCQSTNVAPCAFYGLTDVCRDMPSFPACSRLGTTGVIGYPEQNCQFFTESSAYRIEPSYIETQLNKTKELICQYDKPSDVEIYKNMITYLTERMRRVPFNRATPQWQSTGELCYPQPGYNPSLNVPTLALRGDSPSQNQPAPPTDSTSQPPADAPTPPADSPQPPPATEPPPQTFTPPTTQNGTKLNYGVAGGFRKKDNGECTTQNPLLPAGAANKCSCPSGFVPSKFAQPRGAGSSVGGALSELPFLIAPSPADPFGFLPIPNFFGDASKPGSPGDAYICVAKNIKNSEAYLGGYMIRDGGTDLAPSNNLLADLGIEKCSSDAVDDIVGYALGTGGNANTIHICRNPLATYTGPNRSSYGGMFQKLSSGSKRCMQPNALTGNCSCPFSDGNNPGADYTKLGISVIVAPGATPDPSILWLCQRSDTVDSSLSSVGAGAGSGGQVTTITGGLQGLTYAIVNGAVKGISATVSVGSGNSKQTVSPNYNYSFSNLPAKIYTMTIGNIQQGFGGAEYNICPPNQTGTCHNSQTWRAGTSASVTIPSTGGFVDVWWRAQPVASSVSQTTASCPCKRNSGVALSDENFCFYPANTPGCAMVAAGGYCDGNKSDSVFSLGTATDWVRGWTEYHNKYPNGCTSASTGSNPGLASTLGAIEASLRALERLLSGGQ